MLEPAILAALSKAEAHGYGLLAAIEEMTAGSICADTGGIYRTLARLEELGLVESAWEEAESGPQRRTYRITGDGRDALSGWTDWLRARARALDAIADVADGGI